MNLSIENLSFKYGRRKPYVLKDVSLKFSEGGVVGLLGPNGAGKSTLLYLIAGALTPLKGGVNYDSENTRKRMPQTLSQIYLVAEEAKLPSMSLQKYVELYSKFYPGFDIEVMEICLKEFEMFRPEKLDSLSMGQKKKILLSFALACNTQILLLDEPTNGLDIPGKAAFRRLVARFASKDRLFLISTHQVRDLDSILDHVLIMNECHMLLNASVMQLQKSFKFPRGERKPSSNALYSLPTFNGVDTMCINDDDSETEINLEILFDATLKSADKINSLLRS